MSTEYWRAKIWGLLHDPVLKALHEDNSEPGENSFYEQLEAMKPWIEINRIPEESAGKVLKNILLAECIASASDRAAIGSVTAKINYAPSERRNNGLDITHLLSGATQEFKIREHQTLITSSRKDYLAEKQQQLLQLIPKELQTADITDNIAQIKKLYWWLWRCLPQATCDLFNDSSLMLMPAETGLPDASIWSHVSMTSALAGALAGYDLTLEEVKQCPTNQPVSHPYLAVFSFSPVQELIKASRKMRDFWAGSWLLHYLSAKVCWKLANQYGPDTLLYPSLYQQPLIDHWLLQTYPEFQQWVTAPTAESLLTAGFPNVIVLVLPKAKVKAAMQTAQQTLMAEWQHISKLVLEELQNERYWMRNLDANHSTWEGWLQSQWQFYWTALPIGKEGEEFNISADENKDQELQKWCEVQNKTYNLDKPVTGEGVKLFKDQELKLLREAYKKGWEREQRDFSANVGSWWGYIFDATRASLASVKNARNWQIPTAFGPRSTISGIGPVVNTGQDWTTEGDTKKLWSRQAGLFDGTEQLNATETLKRSLPKIIGELLGVTDLQVSYPDLTSGVAGYLKVNQGQSEHQNNFNQACQAIISRFTDTKTMLQDMRSKWGIPWRDKQNTPKQYHPRLLNSGWLVEELEDGKEFRIEYTQVLNRIISQYYPQNNPSSWYVLAAGDGDGMSEWLKGAKMKAYKEYIPSGLDVDLDNFPQFLELKKRMGPSTHNALSRALLDFSNQLVPYLTECRYAGKLIYGGGDDVLAYTNLWEWDEWLWDIRQCFQGGKDPKDEFSNAGDYWQYKGKSQQLVDRPLFTMGSAATISFGIIIAHHSVPLAIALESLWEAEKKAKEHQSPEGAKKDAVQVRVLYGNGNTLKSTAKFDVFHQWQILISGEEDSALFEQAASLWSQHPAPNSEAILPWTQVFCDRRDQFQNNQTAKAEFQQKLGGFLNLLFTTTEITNLNHEVENWLKLAAFVKRNRHIKIGGGR